MQKVVVFDVAASSGGAMSVLKSFYNEAVMCRDIHWVFVLSAEYVEPTDNITVKTYSWVKKSRLQRLVFDYFVAPAIVREEAPEYVLSLQNINVPFVKTKQITYVHQAIPFCDVRLSLRKNTVEWIYQNVIARFIFRSIRSSDAVVVQTQWMKEAVINRVGIPLEKVMVAPMAVIGDPEVCHIYDVDSQKRFFYPAAYASYKNHAVIIKAAQVLRDRGICDYEIYFTLEPQELPTRLQDAGVIRCIGRLPFKQVQELYSRSVLLFPSLLETFGLPLAEAAAAGSPVVAADLPYAKEVLSGYENAEFFDPYDPEQLADIMMRHILGEYVCREHNKSWFDQRHAGSGWSILIRYIKEG